MKEERSNTYVRGEKFEILSFTSEIRLTQVNGNLKKKSTYKKSIERNVRRKRRNSRWLIRENSHMWEQPCPSRSKFKRNTLDGSESRFQDETQISLDYVDVRKFPNLKESHLFSGPPRCRPRSPYFYYPTSVSISFLPQILTFIFTLYCFSRKEEIYSIDPKYAYVGICITL